MAGESRLHILFNILTISESLTFRKGETQCQRFHSLGGLQAIPAAVPGGSTRWHEIPFFSPSLALGFLFLLLSTCWCHFSQCIEITISFFPSFLAWLAYILMERTCFWKMTNVGLSHPSWVWPEGNCWATQSRRGQSKMSLVNAWVSTQSCIPS